MKSVLFVLPATAVGGAETKFFNIIKYLSGSGMRSILLTQSSIAEYFSVLGVKLYTFEKYGCTEPMPVSIKKMLRYAGAIAETALHEHVDCMVGVMHTGCFYVSAAKDIFRLKIAHIGTIEGNLTAFFKMEGRSPSYVEKCLLWYLLRRPSVIAVPSKGVGKDLEENFRVMPGKIAVIYNGIDIGRIRSMEEETDTASLRGRYRQKTIVTACRLNAQKDFPTLLMAFREVRSKVEARLVIIGDGELKGEIIRQAQDLGIYEHIMITGFRENPFAFFEGADVFVLSSFAEGFGNVIVEAMALGIPVVATDCPSGPSEIIQHGINGFLVPLRDHHAMAEAIIHLLTDGELRQRFAAIGRARAECFGVETMVQGFKGLISKIC